MRILVIEDDAALRKIVSTILKEEEYEVEQSENGKEGLFMARSGMYDLLIVDLMLPGLDGLSLIRELHVKGMNVPTLILTAKDSIEDKVKGLDVGADDYLVKPFATEEFLARVRSVLRRAGKMGLEGKITYGNIVLDMNSEKLFYWREVVKVNQKRI